MSATAPLREQFANAATSPLDGDIDNAVTSLDVIDASLFPPTGNFRILIEAEWMVVTAVSGNTFTVIRGAEGSSAASHTDGNTVTQVVTVGALYQLGWDNDPGWQGARPPFIMYDDTATQISSSTFTHVNAGVSSFTDVDNQLVWVDPDRAGGDDVRLQVLTPPATPYSLIANIQAFGPYAGQVSFGLGFRNSTSGKICALFIEPGQVAIRKYTDANTETTALLSPVSFQSDGRPWLMVTADGTNLIYSVSVDGVTWLPLASEPKATFFSGGNLPNQVGIVINNNDGTYEFHGRVNSFSFM